MSESKELFIAGLLTGAFVIVLMFIFNLLTAGECSQAGKRMEINTEYRFLSGCMVKVDNKWVPYDKYRVVE